MINKNYIIFLMFVLIFTSLVFAKSNINSEYFISEKGVNVNIVFGKVSNFELEIPSDAKNIEVDAESYELNDYKNSQIIKINFAKNLLIRYSTKSFIDKSGNKLFFTMRNNFNESSNVKIYFSEGAVLSEKGILFPTRFKKITDGRRIILELNDFNEEQIVVTYEFVKKNNFLFYLIVIFIFSLMIFIYFLEKNKIKKEIKNFRKENKKLKKEKYNLIKDETKEEIEERLIRNLFEDEKIIVKYLLYKKNNECWTKEIVKDLDISKVKLSRKLRSLEQKGIVKKIPYGNENRIKLLK